MKRDKSVVMMTSTAPWTLLTALVGALALTACKKEGDAKPPEDGGDTAASGGDAGGGDGGGGGEEEKVDGVDFLTVDVFEEVMQANGDDVLECYQDTKAKKPDLGSGKLAMDFTVGGDGMISEIKADDSSSIKSDELNACVKEKAKGWKFPKTRDGQPMTLPFTFTMQ